MQLSLGGLSMFPSKPSKEDGNQRILQYNPVAWYDMEDSSTVSIVSIDTINRVSGIQDKSVNGFHLTQDVLDYMPFYQTLPNGKKFARFVNNDLLRNIGFAAAQPVAIFFVAIQTQVHTNGVMRFFDSGDLTGTTDRINMYYDDRNPKQYVFSAGNAITLAGSDGVATPSLDDLYLYTFIVNGAFSAVKRHDIPIKAGDAGLLNAGTQLVLGASVAEANYLDGGFCEMIWVPLVDQIPGWDSDITDYLLTKWGLS